MTEELGFVPPLHANYEAHPVGIRTLVPWAWSWLTTHLDLVLRSRMLGVIPPLHCPYIFMVWCVIKHGQVYFFMATHIPCAPWLTATASPHFIFTLPFQLHYITLNTICVATRPSCDVRVEQTQHDISVYRAVEGEVQLERPQLGGGAGNLPTTWSLYTSTVQSLHPWSDRQPLSHPVHGEAERALSCCVAFIPMSGHWRTDIMVGNWLCEEADLRKWWGLAAWKWMTCHAVPAVRKGHVHKNPGSDSAARETPNRRTDVPGVQKRHTRPR